MRRREFITLIGGAWVTWPLPAHAQQGTQIKRVGVLMGISERDPQAQPQVAAFTTALRELGWQDGRNIRIDFRWAGADIDRMQRFANELVNLKCDLIVAHSTAVLAALKRETNTIPIVFVFVSDPVGSGFVANLPRPGGSITGFHNFEPAIGGKWLAFLKQIAPDLRRVAVVHVPEIVPNVAFLHVIEAAAPSLGLSVMAAEVRNAADIERVLSAFGQEGGGLIVTPSALTATQRNLIIALAARHR